MNIHLIKGSFSAADATELITQLIQVKIKFHENKISNTHSEEDIKMGERRIKQLQQDLYAARNFIKHSEGNIAIESELLLSK